MGKQFFKSLLVATCIFLAKVLIGFFLNLEITSLWKQITDNSLNLLFLLSPILAFKLNHSILDEKYVYFTLISCREIEIYIFFRETYVMTMQAKMITKHMLHKFKYGWCLWPSISNPKWVFNELVFLEYLRRIR